MPASSTPLINPPAVFKDLHVATAFSDGLNPSAFLTPAANGYMSNMPLVAASQYGAGYVHQSGTPYFGVSASPFGNSIPMQNLPVAATNMVMPAQAPPACPNCQRTFTRVADLERHAKKHRPGSKAFQCAIKGCKYRR